MKSSVIATTAILSLGFSSINTFADTNVIYGKDNRKDLYEITNPLHLELADSTVVLVKKGDVVQNSSGIVKIMADSFQDTMNVCSEERFADQPSGGFCSGALIGKKTMLTAGHCITDMNDCHNTKFVFNYAVTQKGKYPSEVPEKNVVGCKNIIYRIQENTGADFAIIELDRTITHKKALKLADRSNSELKKGDALVMIGSPAGLPTKVDDGGKVRKSASGFFVATTDSYGGNSGSSVFNAKTGEIEGVLVRGEQDYISNGSGCYVSNVCTESGCRGEDVTKISAVLPHLPAKL